MPKKTKPKKPRKKQSSFEKEIKKIEKGIEREIEDVEQWIIERKKFLVKLGWVIGFITVLLIVSHFYLV